MHGTTVKMKKVTKYVSSTKVNSVRFEVPTAMPVQVTIFSHETPYSLIVIFRIFGGTSHTTFRADLFYYGYGGSRFLRLAVKLLPHYMTSTPQK
jgi:hypothetical protein